MILLASIFVLVFACGETQAAASRGFLRKSSSSSSTPSQATPEQVQQQQQLRGRQLKQQELSEKVKYMQKQIESYLEGNIDADEVVLNSMQQSIQHYQEQLNFETLKLDGELLRRQRQH